MADTPSQRITISDVARQAGVSRTTVSHALNGRGQVDPATRLKVEEAARSLGYRPNRHAQRLRTGGASMIALMSSMPFTVSGGPSRLGFFMEVAAVAASSALERGLVMALVPPHRPGQTSLNLLDIDGALVIEPQAGDPRLAELLQQGLPVVSIGRPGGDNVNVPYVDLLSGPATQMLLTHMLAAGARQIGLVVGASERTSYGQAEQAYAAMAAGHGMQPVVLRMDEAEGEDGGHAAAQQLLGEHPEEPMHCWSWSMPLPWALPATPSRQACAFRRPDAGHALRRTACAQLRAATDGTGPASGGYRPAGGRSAVRASARRHHAAHGHRTYASPGAAPLHAKKARLNHFNRAFNRRNPGYRRL